MKKARLAVVAIAVLAGCGELPTSSENKDGPPVAGGPSYDGGLVFGSGNRAHGDSTQTTTSTASSDSTGRGGLVFGSGN